MADFKFPPSLWGECEQTAAYLKDCTPTHTLKDKTPYEAYYGKKPDLSHLCELGCKAFVLIQSSDQPKIYNRSIECTLVGYSENSKAFRCWNKQTGHIIVSRNIHFIEMKDARPCPLHPEQVSSDEDLDDECSYTLAHQEESRTPNPDMDEHTTDGSSLEPTETL